MRADDAKLFSLGTRDPLVRRFAHLPESDYSEARVLELIDTRINDGIKHGNLAVLAVADAATDEFVGCLVLFDPIDRSVEAGLWLLPSRRGRGSAAAALDAAVKFVRSCGFTELRARTVPENRASRWVLAWAGFVEGSTVLEVAPSGEEVALVHYYLEIDGVPPLREA